MKSRSMVAAYCRFRCASGPSGYAYGIMNIDFIVDAMDDSGDMRVEDSRFLGPTP